MNNILDDEIYFDGDLVYQRQTLTTGGVSVVLIGNVNIEINEGTEEEPVMVPYQYDLNARQYVRVE